MKRYETYSTRFLSTSLLSATLAALSSGQLALSTESPRTVYQNYFVKFETVATLKELSEFMPRDQVAKVQAVSDEISAATMKQIRGFTPNETAVVGEKVDGSKATLTVRGKFTNIKRYLDGVKPSNDPATAPLQFVPTEGQRQTGTVSMVMEDGAWKIAMCKWDPIPFHDVKVLTARGQAIQNADAARQTTTKFVKGKLYEQPFGLVRAQYDGNHLFLDGGTMPSPAVMKPRAHVTITFATPVKFPGAIFKATPGQQTIAVSNGTIKSPNVYFMEDKGTMTTGSNVTNSDANYNGYSMLLKFMQPNASGQLPGYIDLVVPSHGSTHITGFFYATPSSTKLADW